MTTIQKTKGGTMKPQILFQLEKIHLNTPEFKGLNEDVLSMLVAQRDADAAYYEPLIEQAKAEVARGIEPLVDKLFEALDHADFSNGIEANGVDEGRVMASRHIGELGREYLSWKSKYGGKK